MASDFASTELPPRARRIRRRFGGCQHRIGTTSACAENTKSVCVCWWSTRNYLRVRGEYAAWSAGSALLRELPPRARRIPVADDALVPANGTTSACAENTRYRKPPTRQWWNYLRVRGEYTTNARGKLTLLELPPRARRIRWVGFRRSDPFGTTSACAENTGFTGVRCG